MLQNIGNVAGGDETRRDSRRDGTTHPNTPATMITIDEKTSFAEWISQMETTREEVRRVRALNWKEIEENKRIKTQNDRLAAQKKPLLKYTPLPHKINSFAQECLDRESAAARLMKERSPDQWLKIIKSLPKRVQSRVACLVWWDYFGGQRVDKRWAHLDDLISKPYQHLPLADVIEGLTLVGYTPWAATCRVSFDDLSILEKEEEKTV